MQFLGRIEGFFVLLRGWFLIQRQVICVVFFRLVFRDWEQSILLQCCLFIYLKLGVDNFLFFMCKRFRIKWRKSKYKFLRGYICFKCVGLGFFIYQMERELIIEILFFFDFVSFQLGIFLLFICKVVSRRRKMLIKSYFRVGRLGF